MPKVEYLEDKEKFTPWSKGFHAIGYRPPSVPEWFDRVQKAHQEIRKVIGGHTLTKEIQLEESVRPANSANANTYIDYLLRLGPGYLQAMNLQREDLYNAQLPNGMKTTKSLRKYLETNLNDFGIYRYAIDSYLSALGQEYDLHKISKQTLHVMLTTKAEAFAMLGHFGPDEGSCFGQNGANAHHKYILGQTRNTFVMLVGDKQLDPDDLQATEPIARAWGFWAPRNKTFNVCNVYIRGAANAPSIRLAIGEFFKSIIQQDIKILDDAIRVSTVYHNRRLDWTYTTQDPTKLKTQTLRATVLDIKRR